MIDKPKSDADRQAIATALNQLSETMDVMQQIVKRLQRSVDQAEKRVQLEQQVKRTSTTLQQAEPDGTNDKPRGKTPVLH